MRTNAGQCILRSDIQTNHTWSVKNNRYFTIQERSRDSSHMRLCLRHRDCLFIVIPLTITTKHNLTETQHSPVSGTRHKQKQPQPPAA